MNAPKVVKNRCNNVVITMPDYRGDLHIVSLYPEQAEHLAKELNSVLNEEKRDMKDRDYLTWLVQRLVHVYGESSNVDFVHKLAAIAEATPHDQETFWTGSESRIVLNKEVRAW